MKPAGHSLFTERDVVRRRADSVKIIPGRPNIGVVKTADLGAKLLRTRWFVRAPIGLFRARLGFVFGGRLLLLEHLGRKSGRWRDAVVETVARPKPDTVVIASGFGTGAQWYRNLQAQPECRVSIGGRYRAAAVARTLADTEAVSVLARYKCEHPRAYRELSGVIEAAIGGSIDEVPLVELTLRG